MTALPASPPALVLLTLTHFGTTRQPIAVWHIFFHKTYKFFTFLLCLEITDLHRLTDIAAISVTGLWIVRYGTWAAVNCQN